MMKKILIVLGVIFIGFFSTQQAFALECGLIGGRITDTETEQGIAGATITLFFDGQQDSLHPVSSREDGNFTYGWPSPGNVRIEVTAVKSGYQSTTQQLTSCTGDTIWLIPTYTPPPSENPRCDYSCADDDQCSGASDGCTKCYSGTCINPLNVPGKPEPPNVLGKPEPPSKPDKCKGGEISTAIGCINVESPEDFVGSILKFALGIGGGIAVLLIIIGGVQVLTSAGNPEKAKAGKELITSAVSGLLLIIFAVFLLKLIGKDILGIFP